MSLIQKIVQKKYTCLFLLVIFLIAIFLRFYHFEQFVTFLGDQGRDSIVIKRILTLEHLTAIGASSSVGGVYLGPFYYYFIAPWLWFFNYNPVGPAFGVALFSSLYILISYYITKRMFDQKIAIISTILITFSSNLINLSRFSWNPNLLPLFSLITVYLFINAFNKNKYFHYFLAGLFLSLITQLHYLSLLLIPPLTIYYLCKFYKDKKIIINIKYVLFSILAFVIFSSPLIIFDLRHQFINIKSFVTLFSHSNNYSSNRIMGFLMTFRNLNQNVINVELPLLLTSILLIGEMIALYLLKKMNNVSLFLIIVFFYIFGLSFFNELKSYHYFGTVYPFYFIILSYYLSQLLKKTKVVTIILILVFIYFNSKSYYFLNKNGPDQINKAKKVAQVILDNSHQKKYTLISLPERSSEAPYRYFLEIWGKKPQDRDIPQKTDELFITCDQPCLTIGNPQWDIAYFAPIKIDQTWKVEDVIIYKLSH